MVNSKDDHWNKEVQGPSYLYWKHCLSEEWSWCPGGI